MEQLIKIQSELKAPKNQFNAFGKYKYRSQEDILEALKPLLEKYKCTLTISDEIKEIGGLVFVEATAKISDGKQFIEVTAQAGVTERKGMDLAQSFGSSSSYARKYALNGLFLIDDTKDADATNTHGKEVKDLNTPEPENKPIQSTDPFLPWLNVLDKEKNLTPQWTNVVQAINDGKITSVNDVRKHYLVSKETAEKIENQLNNKTT